MKKKPHPAIEVEFTIQPHADGTATVTARVLRQEVRCKKKEEDPIVFGEVGLYDVSSAACLEVAEKTLHLHGINADKESASRVFDTLSDAQEAVTTWTSIIKAYQPLKPSKTPKPPDPIVTVARSGGVA